MIGSSSNPYRATTITIGVDASSPDALKRYLEACLDRSGDSRADLLEAEILLRDPSRFLSFAAEMLAQASSARH